MRSGRHTGRRSARRSRVAAISASLFAIFTTAADAQPPRDGAYPQRIVSMNLCTDELLMRIVDPSRIASITYLSQQAINGPLGLDAVASKLKINHGLAEEVLMQEPDLILAGRFTSATAVNLLRKLGYNIVVFDPENTLDDMRANIRKLGEAVGSTARAEEIIVNFDKRLAHLQAQIPPGDKPVFADIGVNNFIAGENTLYTHIVNASGYRTLGQALGFDGFRNVPLEEVLSTKPALISTATPWTSPPSMSTMLRRRAPIEAPREMWVPRSSGPRCTIASVIASRTSSATTSGSMPDLASASSG